MLSKRTFWVLIVLAAFSMVLVWPPATSVEARVPSVNSVQIQNSMEAYLIAMGKALPGQSENLNDADATSRRVRTESIPRNF